MVPAIVLAAGRSTRMGRAKALLMLDRETFLSRVVRTLRDAHVDDVVVVLGHEPDAIVADCERRALNVRFAINRDYDAGQLTSLLTGLRVIDRPGVAAALVTLVDVPLVTASTVRAVLERYRRTHATIVRPVVGGRHGHPVLIDRALFGDGPDTQGRSRNRQASPEHQAQIDLRRRTAEQRDLHQPSLKREHIEQAD